MNELVGLTINGTVYTKCKNQRNENSKKYDNENNPLNYRLKDEPSSQIFSKSLRSRFGQTNWLSVTTCSVSFLRK